MKLFSIFLLKKTNIKLYLTCTAIIAVIVVVTSCEKQIRYRQYIIKTGKKGYYSIANKKTEIEVNPRAYINTNISSVSLEEALFLEDLELKFQRQNGQNIAVGRKFYIQNKITTEIFPWDRTDLMGKIGNCRSQQTTLMQDLLDDGKVNNSAKALCLEQDNVRKFKKGQIMFIETDYSLLEDWHGDDFKDALHTFLHSCTTFKGNKLVQSRTFSIGTEADWRELCNIGKKYYKAGYEKMFFERYFSPFRIKDKNNNNGGRFTAYYLWELPVSLTKTDKYWYPIYSIPTECKIAKRCPSRNEINTGILDGRGLEVGWTSNPMDVYFMQLQGSGIGVTDDGKQYKFVFSGHNNMKFVPYGEFIKRNPRFCPVRGYGKIIEWLNKNPDKALKATSIAENYVFFERKSGIEPVIGSQGVPLTQSRSIAIDPKYIPYGVPMWIQTHIAVVDLDNHDDDKWIDWNRLYIAQDTGSAIKGVVRADLYMGHGQKGEFIAKNQDFPGTWYMLIPNSLVNKIR